MNIQVQHSKNPKLEAQFRQRLKSFPLYLPEHYVEVSSSNLENEFQYREHKNPRLCIHGTKVEFGIRGKITDIGSFRIDSNHRRKGLGKQLYEIIESICIESECERIITSPSEQGKYFWPKMGFRYSGKGMAQKRLV